MTKKYNSPFRQEAEASWNNSSAGSGGAMLCLLRRPQMGIGGGCCGGGGCSSLDEVNGELEDIGDLVEG